MCGPSSTECYEAWREQWVVKKWTFTKQIVCSWFVVAVIFVAILLAIAIPITYSLGSTASDKAESSLSTQTQSSLLLSANATSLAISRRFTVIQQSVLRVLQRSTRQFFVASYSGIAQTSYWHFDSTTLPSDTAADTTRQAGTSVSLTHSSIYSTNATKTDVTTSGYFTTAQQFIIDRSAMLDIQLASLYAQHSEIISIFTAFDASPLYRLFPGQTVPQSVSNPTFDARSQGWYQAAKTAAGQIITTDPFYDTARAIWLITSAVALTDDSGTIFGVVGCTWSTSLIRYEISTAATQFLSTGYTAIIQLAELNGIGRSNLIIGHASWNGSVTSSIAAGTTAAPSLTEVDSIYPSAAIAAAGTGVAEYVVNSISYYAARAQFLSNYMVLTIAPKSEAFVTTSDLDDTIKQDEGIVVGVTVGLCALTIIVTCIVAYITASSISLSLNHMTNTADIVTKSRSSTDDRSNSSHYRTLEDSNAIHDRDEIGRLTRAFQEAVASVDRADRSSSLVASGGHGSYPANKFYNKGADVPWKRGPAILTAANRSSLSAYSPAAGTPGSLPFPVGPTIRGASNSVSTNGGSVAPVPAPLSPNEVKMDERPSRTATIENGDGGQRIRFHSHR